MSSQVYFVLLFSFGAVCMDLTRQKVSNGWICLGLLLGLCFRISSSGIAGVLAFCTGVLFPLFGLYPMFLCRMLGAGDIKLLCVLGGFLGFQAIAKGILLSFGIGAVFALGFLLVCRNWLERMVYLARYVHRCRQAKCMLPYKRTGAYPENFHFTVPVFLGMLLYAGGFY